jgi:hypothetical protein
MRWLPVCILFVATACTGGDPAADAASDTTVGDAIDDNASIPCDANTGGSRGSYVCGTCNNDGIIVPTCSSGALTCGERELVYCPCGVAGLGSGCCDRCDHAVGGQLCNAATGTWECGAGTFACALYPPPVCTDGGTD